MKRKLIILTVGITLLGITGCSNNKDILEGKWIAKTENQKIYQINKDGDTTGGKEDYILECDGKGSYTITLENKETKGGTYNINNNIIVFKDDSDLLIAECKLDNNEITCDNETSTYALKYTKYFE